MKKLSLALAAIAVVGFTASVASAQCNFNAPKKAKGMKTSMVRGYAACIGSITFPSNNTTTNAGVPACTPPFALSAFQFNSKGACTVQTKSKLEKPCATDPTNPACSNTTLKAKCKGIVESDGVTLIATPGSAQGWGLNTIARATFNDGDAPDGDMTVFDFPAQFAFPDGSKGKLKLSANTSALLNDLFGPGSELPACTALELRSIAIADSNGNIFATVGNSTR